MAPVHTATNWPLEVKYRLDEHTRRPRLSKMEDRKEKEMKEAYIQPFPTSQLVRNLS